MTPQSLGGEWGLGDLEATELGILGPRRTVGLASSLRPREPAVGQCGGSPQVPLTRTGLQPWDTVPQASLLSELCVL